MTDVKKRKMMLHSVWESLLTILIFFCFLFCTVNNALSDVKEISLGEPSSAKIVKGSSIVIPPIIWHIYTLKSSLDMIDTMRGKITSDIKTVPMFNKMHTNESLKEFTSSINEFKEKYSDVKKLKKYEKKTSLQNIMNDKMLLSDAMNLGIITKSNYVILTFFTGDGFLNDINTEARWNPNGTYSLSANLHTEAYLIVLDIGKNSIVHHAYFEKEDNYNLRGECERRQFNSEFVTSIITPKNKETVISHIEQLSSDISKSLNDNSAYIANTKPRH